MAGPRGVLLISLMETFGLAGAPIPIVLSALNAACSSSSTGGDAGGSTIADTACTDSARAMCTELESCTPASLQTTYGDEPTCELRIKAACLSSLAAPSTGANPDKTEACAQAYPSYGCTDYRNKTNIPAPCLPATGSLPSGGGCAYAGQCQSGFCAITPGSACGQCASMPKQGDSCAQLTSCGPTLTCASDALVCTALATQGQPCGMGQPCGAGLSCVAASGAGTPGTCQTAGAQVGAACDGSLKTGPSCDGELGFYCDGLSKQCAQTLYAGDQQACGYDSTTGADVQCTSGTCQGSDPSHAMLGQCEARAPDNGACSVPDGGASAPSAGCLPPARCITSGDAGAVCAVATASSCN